MSDRPAGWRMPTPKQMEKLAAAAPVGRNVPAAGPLGPGDNLPEEYWSALLNDAGAGIAPPSQSTRTLKLSEISWDVLRVSCSKCHRIVEIQKADAMRFFGAQTVWKDAAHRLLDGTCSQRTGRHEEDGCWPEFE